MITLTRRLARRLRAVLRQALRLSSRGPLPPVWLEAGPEGLRARCHTVDAGVEFHQQGPQPAERFWVPLGLLAKVEGAGEEPVQLVRGEEAVWASWRDGGVPQVAAEELAAPGEAWPWPSLPTLAENPPALRAALGAAMETTDPEAIRYALGCVQLQGAEGRIVATDGRQLLAQAGFAFPWDEDVLLPRTRLFGCRELPAEAPVLLGRQGAWLVLRLGPWTIRQRLETEGRFPQVHDQLPAEEPRENRLELPAADAAFLARALPRLPGDEERHGPVTVELDGQVVVRARAARLPHPIELVLEGACYQGPPMRIHTNRRFLARAIELGFRRLYVPGPRAPVLAWAENRQYVWALLDPQAAIPPDRRATRLESASGEPRRPLEIAR